MVYKVIGLMSGSSLDGLDIAYVHLQERAVSTQQTPGTQQTPRGQQTQRVWDFELVHTDCYPYPVGWRERLAAAPGLGARDYQLLHTEYGHYLGAQVLRFIEAHGLEYQVQLIASHGHTTLHWPERRMTAQLGDGAALAATTRVNVVSDLRSMDIALGGQGAPIVPIGEKLLLPGYSFFLNLGGIANISAHGAAGPATPATPSGTATPSTPAATATPATPAATATPATPADGFVAFDVCPANRVLNELAAEEGLAYDKDGALAAGGHVDAALLQQLNALPYYGQGYPKSLGNEFGLETVLPLVRGAGLSVADGLRTYVEHLVAQIGRAIEVLGFSRPGAGAPVRMLVTGGGAHNGFLVARLQERMAALGAEVVVPEQALVDYKEALVMALIGVLRWREENNVLASVTGASRDSIGGAVWIGQEA